MRKQQCLVLLILFFGTESFVAAGSASSAFEQAQGRFRKGAYDEAIKLFETAAKDKTYFVKASIGLGRVLFEKGEYNRAKVVYQQVLTKLPNQFEAITCLANVFKVTGQYDAARARYEKVLTMQPFYLEALLGLGETEWLLGKRVTARKFFQGLISYYQTHRNFSANQLSFIAQACVHLNRITDANNLYFEAGKVDTLFWQGLVPWGELMLAKYNTAHARGIFEDALQINPNSVGALLGLAKSSRNTPYERASAEKALKVNPNFVPALDYLAELDLAHGNYSEVITRLDKALVVNPNSLTSLSLRAVTFFFLGDTLKFHNEERRVLAINPKYGELYFQLAELLSKHYLFAESTGYYRKAIKLDPEHWPAYAGLGTSLSRLGREAEAKKQLERAFAKDAYNKYVGNLLTLFDELPDYKTYKTKYITVKLHKEEEPILAPYATALVDESFSRLMKLYPISTDEEIILEVFPSHDDFAVRCFGLPGAQNFLGICFGNVVAMDSPRARAKGGFVWGETLWHELVHVTHLRLTGNRIPRWLAEGIAVFETTRAKPFWAMHLDWPFVMAFLHDRLLPLKDLDSGFSRPTSPGQVSLSYFQASIIVEFIVSKHGREKLVKMFPLFKNGEKTAEVVKQVFGKNLEQFDREFHKFVKQKYRLGQVDYAYDPQDFTGNSEVVSKKLTRKIKTNPNNPFLNFRFGMYWKNKGDFEQAIIYLQKAKTLFPAFVDKENPYKALSEIYMQQGATDKAIQELRQLTALSAKDAGTLHRLADLSMQHKDYKTAIAALRKITYINPFESAVHQKLAKAYLANKLTAAAISELQMNLFTKPQDMAGAYCDLAAAYLLAGKKSEAKKNALSALEIAPGFERAQEILLATID